jgi:hypothetical protein
MRDIDIIKGKSLGEGIGQGIESGTQKAVEFHRKPETIVQLVKSLSPEDRQHVMEGIRGQGNWLTRMFGG